MVGTGRANTHIPIQHRKSKMTVCRECHWSRKGNSKPAKEKNSTSLLGVCGHKASFEARVKMNTEDDIRVRKKVSKSKK